MRRRRRRSSRLAAWAAIFGVSAAGVLSIGGSAAIPASVDSYNGSAFAAGVHSSAGTNAFPNFSGGALDNRYPLTLVTQDGSPASDAKASVNDYGPLAATLITTDCNQPPSSAIPNPNPSAQPNYCLSQVRDLAPYAHAQYPHPPGSGDANAPQANVGDATAHAEELKSNAIGHYTGPGNEPTAPNVSNSTAETHTTLGADGTIDVTTHSHVGRADFAAGAVVVADTDVVTEIKSGGGHVTINTSVSPGTVTAAGQPVAVNDQGVTVGPANQPVGGVAGATPAFRIRTVQPEKRVDGNRGTVLAEGLEVTVINQGVPSQGIESTSISYVLGEGGADGFVTPAQTIPNQEANAGAPVSGSVADTFGSSSLPGYTGSAPTALRTSKSTAKPRTAALAGAVRLPVALLFFVWEGLVFAAAASMVYSRRQRLAEALP